MIGFGQTQTYVPDNVFEQNLINLGLDSLLDSFVTTATIDTVTTLNIMPVPTGSTLPPWTAYASNLIGIEDFILLDSLIVDATLDSVDLSDNLVLRSLTLSSVPSLDLTNNIDLEYVEIGLSNPPTFVTGPFNVNGLTNLKRLEIGGLTGPLDLSTNTSLTDLVCGPTGSFGGSSITSLNVNGAVSLENLNCSGNQLTNLDVSNNTALTSLHCENNNLLTLNLSSSIEYLNCDYNKLTSLDLSMCSQYYGTLRCQDNELTSLDLRTGTNMGMYPIATGNFLQCVDVDSVSWSYINWPLVGPVSCFDPTVSFSTNCSGVTSIQEHTTNKELLKVTDLLGRDTKQINQLLLYLYEDGTVEKKIAVE